MPNQSTAPQPRRQFEKPRPDFPLFPHATGRWAKKVRGKLHYFGKCAVDPKGEAALNMWLDQKDDLLAGRKPRKRDNRGLTIRDLCNQFLTSKLHRLEAGEIAPRTFSDAKNTTDRIITAFGKSRIVEDLDADDFRELRRTMAAKMGPVRLGNEITRVRGVFRFAYENHLIEKPVRFGTDFKPPARRVMRRVRNEREKKFFEAAEIKKLLDSANVQMKAMILLAVNCGLGNSDVAQLPIEAVDLDGGWIDFPRPKTGIERRCPLWPETVKAIRAWLKKRPEPRKEEFRGLLFITSKTRTAWVRAAELENLNSDKPEDIAKECLRASDNPVSKEFRKLLTKLNIKRKGVSFYSLRHVFETIGGESRDQVAVNAIMGHVDESMAATYRERISDERLKAVTDHVRAWLWPPKKKKRRASSKRRA